MDQTAETKPPQDTTIDLAEHTLTGDIRDFLLDYLKHDKNPLPWQQRTEEQQREQVERATKAAERLVRETAKIVAARGQPVISAERVDYKVKGGSMELKLKAQATQRNVIIALDSKFVTVSGADTDPFEGERRPGARHVQKQQPGMFDEGEEPETEQQAPVAPAAEEQPLDPLELPTWLDRKYREDYEAGRRARRAHEPTDNCPHRSGTKKGKAWHAGWHDEHKIIAREQANGDEAPPDDDGDGDHNGDDGGDGEDDAL